MMKHRSFALQLALVGLLIASLLLVGCSGKPAAQPAAGGEVEGANTPAVATQAPAEETAAPEAEATTAPEAEEATAAPAGETTEIQNALDNALKLAPLHLATGFESKKGDVVDSKMRMEADLDAKGNEHIFLYDKDDKVTELYLVDSKLYMGVEGGQFIAVSQAFPKDSAFSFVTMYGGAFLTAYNDLKDARKVGSESVNGFQCDKYEIKYDLASAGLAGLAAGAQGVDWDYQAYAWVETTAKAVVKAQVDWKGKSADDQTGESFHSEFEAKPGTVTEVKAPGNILEMPTG